MGDWDPVFLVARPSVVSTRYPFFLCATAAAAAAAAMFGCGACPAASQDLLTGGTSMKTLCGMSTDELASSHLKEERKRIRDELSLIHI